MFTVILVSIISNFVLQLKTFNFFNQNLNLFLFFFVIMEQFFQMFLTSFLLKEILLVAPIMVSLEYTQQLLIPTQNFDSFLNRSALRLFLVGIVRLTVDPFPLYYKRMKGKLIKYLKEKAQYNEKYDKFLKLINIQSNPKEKMYLYYTN